MLKLVLFGMIFSRTPTSSSANFPVKVAWKHGTGARRRITTAKSNSKSYIVAYCWGHCAVDALFVGESLGPRA